MPLTLEQEFAVRVAIAGSPGRDRLLLGLPVVTVGPDGKTKIIRPGDPEAERLLSPETQAKIDAKIQRARRMLESGGPPADEDTEPRDPD